MTTEQQLPENHPIMRAWTQYKTTREYENSWNWAVVEEHRGGSMWSAFLAGYQAASAPKNNAPGDK